MSRMGATPMPDWTATIHEGHGVGLLLIDEHADEGQRQAILALVGGQAGGPLSLLTEVRFEDSIDHHVHPPARRFRVEYRRELSH
jgi:hypothetical protein